MNLFTDRSAVAARRFALAFLFVALAWQPWVLAQDSEMPPAPAGTATEGVPLPTVADLFARADAHEAAGRVLSALTTLQRIYDRSPATPPERQEATQRFIILAVSALYGLDAVPRWQRQPYQQQWEAVGQELVRLFAAALQQETVPAAISRAYARVALGASRLEDAVEYAHRAVEADGEDVEAWWLLAQAQMLRGEEELARLALYEILDKEPGRQDALSSLFQMVDATRPTDEGRRVAEMLLAEPERFPMLVRRAAYQVAIVALNAGETPAAIAAMDAALPLVDMPDLWIARALASDAQLPVADVVAALSWLRTDPYEWLQPNRLVLLDALIDAHGWPALHAFRAYLRRWQSGQTEAGWRDCEAAGDDLFSAETPWRLTEARAALALRAGQSAIALQGYATLAAMPEASDDWLERRDGLHSVVAGDIQLEALLHYLQALPLVGISDAERPGTAAEIVEHLQAALALSPDYTAAHALWAFVAFHQARNYAEALSHAEAALQRDADNVGTLEIAALSAILAPLPAGADVNARLSKAETHLRALTTAMPDAETYREFAQVCVAIRQDRVSWPAYREYALALLAPEEERQPHLEAALTLQPDFHEAHMAEGRQLLRIVIQLTETMLVADDEQLAEIREGILVYDQQAQDHFTAALRHARNDAQVAAAERRLALCAHLALRGSTDEAQREELVTAAREHLDRALLIEPTDREAMMLDLNLRREANEGLEAHAALSTLLRAHPDYDVFPVSTSPQAPAVPILTNPLVADDEPATVPIGDFPEVGQTARYEIVRTDRDWRYLGSRDSAIYRFDMTVRERPAPGYAVVGLELIGVEGAPALRALLDRDITVEISQTLGMIDIAWPEVPADFPLRDAETGEPDMEAWIAVCTEFRLMVIPLWCEAWVWSPGGETLRRGQQWSKRGYTLPLFDTGLQHLRGQAAEGYQAAVDDAGVWTVTRQSRGRETAHGTSAALDMVASLSPETGQVTALTYRYQDVILDPADAQQADLMEATTDATARLIRVR